MALTPENPFQTAINEFIEKQEAVQKKNPSRTTTVHETIGKLVKEYPRTAITGGIAAGAGYTAIKNWRKNLLEGIKTIQGRRAQELAAVKELAGKGVTAFPSMAEFAEAGNQPVREAARAYAREKLFTGFPFYNKGSSGRMANLAQPRVILTGENIPITEFRANLPKNFLHQEYPEVVRTERLSPVAEARPARTVSVDTAKRIPPITLRPREVAGVSEAGTGIYDAGIRQFDTPNRVGAAPKYVPSSELNVPIRKRIAEIATGGKLGRANVGLEAALALYDIAREEGDVRRVYNEAASQGEKLEGKILATMKAASRAGHAAGNAITAGGAEYLGLYDTVDLAMVERDAIKEYWRRRGTAGYPAEKMGIVSKGGEYEPTDSENPYLLAIQGNLAAERGIPASPMASDWYKGPEYTYFVNHKGELQVKMQEGYAAIEEAQNQKAIAHAMRYKPMFNLDPNQGPLGMSTNRSRAFNVGDYFDYNRQ